MKSLTLSTRGSLLVAFPLISQLLIVFVLSVILLSLQSQIEAEQNSREILRCLHLLVSQMIENTPLFSLDPGPSQPRHLMLKEVGDILQQHRQQQPALNSNDSFPAPISGQLSHWSLGDEESIDTILKRSIRQLRYIKLLTKDQEMLRRIDALCDTMNALTSRVQGDSVEKLRTEDALRAHNRQTVIKEMTRIIDGVRQLEQYHEQQHALSFSQQAVSSSSVSSYLTAVLIGALVISTTLAIVMGFMYARGIKRPLQQIADNSRRLAEGEPLLPVVKGCVELSHLDDVLHVAAHSFSSTLDHGRAMIANAADLICSVDEHFRFTAVNPYVQKLLGLEPQDIVGRQVVDFIVPSQVVVAEEHLRIASNCSGLYSFELAVLRNDGVISETRWTTFHNSFEESVFCVVHDSTEEQNIARLRKDFIDMVSHDLLEPLSAMHFAMKEVSQRIGQDVESSVSSESASIATNAGRLIGMVNNLLELNELNSGKIELDIKLNEIGDIIHEAIEMVRDLAQSKQIGIVNRSQHYQLYCDKTKILRTIINLLSNSIKFSPVSSAVEIEVSRSNHSILLCVTDSGPGIPENMRSIIFEAFEQLPGDQRQGTGLGLAICKLIVEAHGGVIGVRPRSNFHGSDSNSGSTFWLKLPERPQSLK